MIVKVKTYTHLFEVKISKLENICKSDSISKCTVFGFAFHIKAEIITIFDCLLTAIENATISCKFGRSKAKLANIRTMQIVLDKANVFIQSLNVLGSLVA